MALRVARMLERHDQHQHVHRRRVPRLCHPHQRVVPLFGEPVVGIDAEERIIGHQRQGLDQSAAGIAQQFALVRHADVEILRMGGQMRFDLVGQIVDIDHNPPDPGIAQQVQHVIEQRRTRHFNQRLGPVGGQRQHPRALPRRHDHRGIWDGVHSSHSPPPAARSSAGILASNQAATGASAGCPRSRSSSAQTRGIRSR